MDRIEINKKLMLLTKNDAIINAKKRWYEYMKKYSDIQYDNVLDYAKKIIYDIDCDGWDEDIHGDIDIAMECYARNTWYDTPWEYE